MINFRNISEENLQYLNVDQALADIAYFIEEKKRELGKENAKVIVFGGSYAGNMAVWARLKYPHLIQVKVFFFRCKRVLYKVKLCYLILYRVPWLAVLRYTQKLIFMVNIVIFFSESLSISLDQ